MLLTVGNDGHVTNVRGLVHEPTDLVYREVNEDIVNIVDDQSARS